MEDQGLSIDDFMARRQQQAQSSGAMSVDDFMQSRQQQAQQPPATPVPHPAEVDQITTQNAQAATSFADMARRVIARPVIPGYGEAPGPAKPPALPVPWETDLQTNLEPDHARGLITGKDQLDIPQWLLNQTYQGVGRAASGIERMAEPGLRNKAGGLHDTAVGAFQAATVPLLGAGAAAPLKTAASVAAGSISQEAVEAGLARLGLPKEYAAVAGDLAGVIAAHHAGKVAEIVKQRVGIELQRRYQERAGTKTDAATAQPPEPQAAEAVPQQNVTQPIQEKQTDANSQHAVQQQQPQEEVRPQETDREGRPDAGAQPGPAAETREVGPHGPVFREYHRDAEGAIKRLLDEKTGEAPGALWHPDVPGEDVDLIHGQEGETSGKGFGLAKIAKWHNDVLADLQGHLLRMRLNPEKSNENSIHLENGPYHAVIRRNWKGEPKTWLLTEYKAGEAPSSGKRIDTPGTSETGRGDTALSPGGAALPPQPEGRGGAPESSLAPSEPAVKPDAAPPPTEFSDDPNRERPDESSLYMGSGLGALEPLFRQAKAEGDAMRAKRDEALAEARKAASTPAQTKAGEKVRAYFTSERDLWAARANQAIDIVTRKILPKTQDREALAIAREFRNHPLELRSFVEGTHPFLDDVDGGSGVGMNNLEKVQPLLRQAMRILAKPTQRERAADRVFTNIARTDLEEGQRGGWLGSRFAPEEYVPHALNAKGEGAVAKLPAAAGRAMGQVGKYFGFGERRSDRYPTIVHAIADGIIPKTLDPSAAFTVHTDAFARARATHLLEAHLAETGLGKWGDGSNAPEGWVQLAAHTDEFKKSTAIAVPGTFDPETRESELRIAKSGLYVPPFIEKAMSAITDPDYTAKIPGFAKFRTAQRGLKEAILGFSGFHLLTENFMAAADVGPRGMLRAFQADRQAEWFLEWERKLIQDGGTTSIQGSTMDAYRGMRPGTIPTRAEVVRAYIPGSKQALEVADAITRLTFDNIQRRFKVVSYMLHRMAWEHDNPAATPDQAREAGQGIASYVNGVYGGLHWENMGWSRAMVEAARAVFLAPDWSGSNIALAKYAADAPLSAKELPFRNKLAGAATKEAAQARLARAFWTKQLVAGLISTQMLSLLFSGQLSPRPFQVYEGDDEDGKEVYQNVVFRGSIGDAVNLGTKIETHASEGYDKNGLLGAFAGVLVGAGVFAGGKAAPGTKLGIHLLTGRDDFGRDVTPQGLAADTLPIPIAGRSAQRSMFSDDASKYLWSERILSLFGSPAQHVAPEWMRRERRSRR